MTNREKVIHFILSLCLGLAGMVIIVKTLGWLAFLGFFLLVWSNNISTRFLTRVRDGTIFSHI